ncbi:hypothetical protein N7507_011878 [Penicillium longicatenatum]|nr:hypothetical protein N7507_011878 [Penicillium longicatenatum]
MSSDIYTPPSTVPPPERPLTGPGSHSLATSLGPVSLPRPHKATMPPGLPRSLCANWSTVLRPDVRQHRLADWSTTPVVCMTFPSAAPARRRRRPTHQGHPANWPARPPPLPALPPKGSPCGTTVQPAGCLAWAVPPGRGSRPPHAGRRSAQWARDTAMPPQSPCRNSACMPASRGSHCAPAPRARPSSPLPGPSSPVLPLYIPSDPF